MSLEIFVTSDEKSDTLWLTELRLTLTPMERRLRETLFASGTLYDVWSSTM